MNESPREAIEATLGLIARDLADERFELKPGLVLRRKVGDHGHVLRCQSSKWNRSGDFAGFQLSAWFESDILSSWTKKRWPGRPTDVTRFDRVVSAMQLKLPGSPLHAEWDVVDPVTRLQIAKAAASLIRAQALPWFEKMADPVAALTELDGAPAPRASLIHYALATGHSHAARERVAALAANNPHFAKNLDAVRQNGKPAAYRNVYEPIAWAAIDCGIA